MVQANLLRGYVRTLFVCLTQGHEMHMPMIIHVGPPRWAVPMLALLGCQTDSSRHACYLHCDRIKHADFPSQRGGQAGAIEVADGATSQGGGQGQEDPAWLAGWHVWRLVTTLVHTKYRRDRPCALPHKSCAMSVFTTDDNAHRHWLLLRYDRYFASSLPPRIGLTRC